LGEGAVGDVHLCVDLKGNRLVVVKWLRAEVHEDSEAARRFNREAELMARASFDGVIQVGDYGVDDYGRTWMAMEFVDGLMPSAVVVPGDAWGVHRLMSGVGRSLDELHGLGVVHRDLKPDNVLVREGPHGWQPVIIDLGIAKWLSEEAATATGSVFGTPHYMSPEQFRDSKHVGPATDRYAVAVIAFELLSGKLPYDGRNLPALLRQHMEDPIPKLQVPRMSERHGVTLQGGGQQPIVPTPTLDAFMQRGLAKNPNERFSSSKEMAAAFEQAAKADGIWNAPEGWQPLFEPLLNPTLELNGPNGVKRFDVRLGPTVLGRHEACHYVLTSPRLSRMHAAFYSHRGRVWIGDLHSQNGTYFNGRPLHAGVPMAVPPDGTPCRISLYDLEVTARCLPA
jgi:serine/threonine-protein kinase